MRLIVASDKLRYGTNTDDIINCSLPVDHIDRSFIMSDDVTVPASLLTEIILCGDGTPPFD